ncbi:hypothetical protein PENSPDRAFT_749894 [Peniophora sp. CONT]|nr:hypothetical protein PENSPDRAFT_749894 [Peniophora sp. CONT]
MSLAPSYSCEPGPDERRLGIVAPNASSQSSSFGTMIQQGNGISIALYNQQDNAHCATYGRGASVMGEISLSTTQGVTAIRVILEAKVEIGFDNMVLPYPKILHISSTLWDTGRSEVCPSTVPFDLSIPESFLDPKTGSKYPLPPSYDTALSMSDLHARCVYQLVAVAVRSRWALNKTLTVDVIYMPRNLPSRTIMEAPFPFFDTVKSAPEEWRQMSAVLPPKVRSDMGPVHCELFTPSVRVFTIRDMIPFFLQLRGQSSSMFILYASGNQQREEGWAQRLRRMAQNTQTAPRITVSIERQVVVISSTGARVARSYTIGTGSLRPVPPGYVPSDLEEGVLTVDYEGEVQFVPKLSVPSFDMGILRILDFVVLSIEPSGSAETHFGRVRQAEGVRIVTG